MVLHQVGSSRCRVCGNWHNGDKHTEIPALIKAQHAFEEFKWHLDRIAMPFNTRTVIEGFISRLYCLMEIPTAKVFINEDNIILEFTAGDNLDERKIYEEELAVWPSILTTFRDPVNKKRNQFLAELGKLTEFFWKNVPICKKEIVIFQNIFLELPKKLMLE